jgi:hypothetical protein
MGWDRQGEEELELMSYAYMTEAISTSQQLISLIFSNCVFMIKGRRLKGLLLALQEDRITRIQAFDARYFDAPPEGEPVINSISKLSHAELMSGGKRA